VFKRNGELTLKSPDLIHSLNPKDQIIAGDFGLDHTPILYVVRRPVEISN
jgi:hypothetical protein